MPRILVLVSNDLVHDQRVAKVCDSLIAMGFDIHLIGRLLPESKEINRNYQITRFKLPFQYGALFYASLNIRLFFFLLKAKGDIILANDLDTLFPAFLISKIRGKNLVYDSHEYFTEAEGLLHNHFAKWVWTLIEKMIFPKLKKVYTVNESIASIYLKKYHVNVEVVRNIPPASAKPEPIDRSTFGVPQNAKVIVLQGAFIDFDRGAMFTAKALEHLPNVYFLLIGAGPEWDQVNELKKTCTWAERLILFPKMEYSLLRKYTASCDLGISLDLDRCLNYRYSLPNKLFDYLHAGIPVLASNLPEIERIMKQYPCGVLVNSLEPEQLAAKIKFALETEHRELWKNQIERVRQDFTWQRESETLKKIYADLL